MSNIDVDEDFETVDAGASMTVPISAGSIKKNGFMVINGRPCKVNNNNLK